MPIPTNRSDSRSPITGPGDRAASVSWAPTGSEAAYFDAKLSMFPGMTIPLRSMLVTANDRQLLISPVATPDEAAQIVDVLPLTVLAPSLLHHLHIPAALDRYRPVALWGPPGFAEKKRELGPVSTFGVDAWPHDAQLGFVVIDGAPRRNEVVFFHRVSRTIYTADLFFNLHQPVGLFASLALHAMGIHHKFAATRMWKHWVKDRAAFARSIDRVLAWDFERIVMAHGDVVETRARDQFIGALRALELIR